MPTPPLTIRLFGPLSVCVHGAPMPPVRTRSVEWLLALLVLRHGRTVDRSWLAGTLWPDSQESQARHNLRDALVHLRKALGQEGERIQSPTRDTLTLLLEGTEVDVVRFDRAISMRGEEALQNAVALYTGSLLESCFEEWVFPERNSREQACLTALEALAEAAEQRKDYIDALRWFQRAAGMDSLRDTIQRGRMRVLAASGDAPAALYAYREYRLRLREEMNVEPDEETVHLYQQIRQQARQSAQRQEEGGRRQKESRSLSPSSLRPPPLARLPHPITALIGREQETQDIAEALSRSRLVTLVGGGGVGKTRLAIEVAGQRASDFAEGAAFVELASLSDPTLLAAVVASALGIREEMRSEPASLLQSLTQWLSTHTVLLVLDNCEHLIEEAASLSQTLLERCRDLHILATSRQRLGLIGEITWRVPSLSFPDPEHLSREEQDLVAKALEYPAVRLFVERAAMASPGFLPATQEDGIAVARICHQLDGIPLAIELAAARVGVLPVGQIASRLNDRFRLLTGGSRTALPRQQTLRALIDWSYVLLSEAEQALLCRLSVFSGGWTLEAAEAVVRDPWSVDREPNLTEGTRTTNHEPRATNHDVLDLLTSLVDKSLVVVERSGASVRYRQLETVRQYALDRLQEGGAERISREKHLAFFLALAEDSEARVGNAGQIDLLSHLEEEHDNLRAALDWSLTEKEKGAKRPEESRLMALSSFDPPPFPDAALRLCSALQTFWRMRGHYTEGREWCSRALSAREAQARTSARAKALNTAGILANIQGDYVSALAYHEESLRIFREIGKPSGIAGSLHGLGNVTSNQGDYAAARAYYEESLALKRELGDRSGIGAVLNNLGNVARNQGDYASARAYFAESLVLFREIGHRPFLSNALISQGRMALLLGDNASAQACYEESLSIEREIGNRHGVANALIHLGNLAHSLNDPAGAQTCYEECLVLYREMADRSGIGAALNNLGGVAYQRGDDDRARAYYEESLVLFREIGHRPFLAISLNGLGNVAARQGDYVLARPYYEESLRIQKEMGDRDGIASSLEAFGHLAVKNARPEQALVLWGATEALREEIGAPLLSAERSRYDRQVAEARAALADDVAFETSWQDGRAMTLEQAIRFALSDATKV